MYTISRTPAAVKLVLKRTDRTRAILLRACAVRVKFVRAYSDTPLSSLTASSQNTSGLYANFGRVHGRQFPLLRRIVIENNSWEKRITTSNS